jgi:hypothetical protein
MRARDLLLKAALVENVRKLLGRMKPVCRSLMTRLSLSKTAQGLREKRVFNLKSNKTQPIPESPITNLFFAAYITSMVPCGCRRDP